MKGLNKEVGRYAEKLAQEYLRKNNYRILDCNFRNYSGEIDIICRKNNILVIVEVKGRYSYEFGVPKESVTPSKQKSIIKVTKSYMLYKKLTNINVRFDVIEVFFNQNNDLFKITHLKDAFRL